MTTVIALVGPAGAGKSSVARHLARRYGARCYSLARPLKEVVRRAFDLSHEQVYGTQAEKEAVDPRYNVSPRWLLQRIGTEGIREVLGRDFWHARTLDEIWKRDRPALAVIDDARFADECAAVRAGRVTYAQDTFVTDRGFVWRVVPPANLAASTDDGSHASETGWREVLCDHVIAPPERGLDHLHEAVDVAMLALLASDPSIKVYR